jgi:putative transposase
VEKEADGDLVREMLAFAAERLDGAGGRGGDRRAEGGALAAAERTQRNGYRPRALWRRGPAGLTWRSQSCVKGSCFPSFLEPRRTAEKALVAVIQEAYVQGISTRDLWTSWCAPWEVPAISKSQVSLGSVLGDRRAGAGVPEPAAGRGLARSARRSNRWRVRASPLA